MNKIVPDHLARSASVYVRPTKRVQVDEIWSFTYAKQKNVEKAKAAPANAGDTWTWTAILHMVSDRNQSLDIPRRLRRSLRQTGLP